MFTLAARPLAKKENALPVSAIVLSMGAMCLLVTCLSKGVNLLVSSKVLWTSIALGVITALAFRYWLVCLATVPASGAAVLWYLALVFGIASAAWIAHLSPGWYTLGGALLILFAARGAGGGRRRPQATMSDLVRR